MTFEQLLSEGRIKEQASKQKAIEDLISLAERDARVAEQTAEVDSDWAFTIAYNSVLQASRAYMLDQGYRPRGPDQHVTVIRFLEEAVGSDLADEIAAFDRMRRKRHRAVYDAPGRIGKSEAGQAVTFAKEYVGKIRQLLARS